MFRGGEGGDVRKAVGLWLVGLGGQVRYTDRLTATSVLVEG